MMLDSTLFVPLAVDATCKVTVLFIVAIIAASVLRRSSSAVRHRLWCLAFLGALAVPLLSTVVPQWRIAVLPAAELDQPIAIVSEAVDDDSILDRPEPASEMVAPVAAMESESLGMAMSEDFAVYGTAPVQPTVWSPDFAESVPIRESEQVGPRSAATWICLLWSAGFLVFLAPIVTGAICNWWLALTGSAVSSGAWFEPVDQIRHALGIRRSVRVIELSNDLVPMTFGVLRPVVFVPCSSHDWSPERRRMVLLHEMAHIKRFDLPFQLIARLACAAYWFNPLVWLGLSRLRLEREQACDDCVVGSGERASDYAHELVEIAVSHHAPRLSIAVGMARNSRLEQRVSALFDRARSHLPLTSRRACGLFVVVMMFVIGIVAIRPVQRSLQAQESEAANDVVAVSSQSAKTASVKGTITSPSGTPIAGADVALVIWCHIHDTHGLAAPPIEVWAKSMTDDQGEYVLEFPAPPNAKYYHDRTYQMAVLAKTDGHGLGWHYLSFDDEHSTASIQLSPQSLRRGRVVDLEGQPVRNARLYVARVGTRAPKDVHTSVRGEGRQGWAQDEVFMTKVGGTKDNALGRDIWEEEVRFYLAPQQLVAWPDSVVTDDDGRFAVPGIAEKSGVTLHLYGNKQAGSQEVRFESGENDKTFAAESPRLIVGTVVDAKQFPVAGAEVRIVPTGATMYAPTMGTVADWKGRQGHVTGAYIMMTPPPYFMNPPVVTRTDEQGKFSLSPMHNHLGPERFVVTVTSPPDRSLMSVCKTILWPGQTTFEQEVELEMPDGVRVSGQVIDADTEEPIAHARLDFWCKSVPYPVNQVTEVTWQKTPDGVVHPHWRKTDFDGRFEIMVPKGKSYLFVNRGTEDNLIDAVVAAEIGASEVRSPVALWDFLHSPGTRIDKPLTYYPDRAVALNYDADIERDDVVVKVQAAKQLEISVKRPGGQLSPRLQVLGGQPPFREPTSGQLTAIKKSTPGKFVIPVRDPTQPVSVTFIDRANKLGVQADIRDTLSASLTLQPLGTAKATVVGPDGEPLVDYRPLMVMSLPGTPYSQPADLEHLARNARAGEGISSWRIVTASDLYWHSVIAYGPDGIKTSHDGSIVWPELVPGALYRVLTFDGKTVDFRVDAGQTKDLGKITIQPPEVPIAYPSDSFVRNAMANGIVAQDAVAMRKQTKPAKKTEDSSDAATEREPPKQHPKNDRVDQQVTRDELRVRLMETVEQFGKRHPKVKMLEAQIEQLDRQLDRLDLSGKVVDQDQKPIAKAPVSVVGVIVTHSRRGTVPKSEVLAELVTDSSGKFSVMLTDVSSNTHDRIHILASADNHGMAWTNVDANAAESTVDFVLPKEQPIKGKLIDIEGQPAAGIQMKVHAVTARMVNGKSMGQTIGLFPGSNAKAWPKSVTSDANGKFSIRNIGNRSGAYVAIEGSDRFAPQSLSLNTGSAETRGKRDGTYRPYVKNLAAGETAVIPLAPAQVFRGIVRYQDTGKPAANARISIWASQQEFGGSMTSVEGKTDSQGEYKIVAKPGIRFGIQAFAPRGTPYLNHQIRDIKWKDEPDANRIDVELSRGVLVKGQVCVDGSNNPVGNVAVQYLPQSVNNDYVNDDMIFGWQGIEQTDDKGQFAIAVPPGPGTVLVTDPKRRFVLEVVGSRQLSSGRDGGRRQYAHAIVSVDPTENSKPIELKIALRPGAKISGRMVDDQGKPIESANVVTRLNIFQSSLDWVGWRVEATHGRFEVSGVPANKKVPVHLLDAKQHLGATFMASADQTSPTVVLKPCGKAKARLLNRDGKPAVGAAVSFNIVVTKGVPRYDFMSQRTGQFGADSDFNANIDRVNYWQPPKSDANGIINFPALIPGATYRILDRPNGRYVVAKEFVAKAGETIDLGDVQLAID